MEKVVVVEVVNGTNIVVIALEMLVLSIVTRKIVVTMVNSCSTTVALSRIVLVVKTVIWVGMVWVKPEMKLVVVLARLSMVVVVV